MSAAVLAALAGCGSQVQAGAGDPTPTPTHPACPEGTVVTRIRCSMATYPDTHAPPSHWADDTAAAVPAGTPVYAVTGFSPRCRLAVSFDGHLRTYVAMKSTKHGPRPLACAKIAV